MARADSTIRVNIVGDAKSLEKAAGKAEGAIGGMNKKLLAGAGIIAGAFAADAVIEFGNTAVKEADRVADAAARVEASLGPDLAKELRDRADDFSKFGASEGDMLELEARIADIGTAAGLSAEQLGPFAEQAAAMASGLEGITDIDAATWIDKIGKAAASGNAKALQSLGIFLDDAAVNAAALALSGKDNVESLTEQEIAAGRTQVVMQLLDEKYGNLIGSSDDLEGKQRELNAKLETLTGQVGEALLPVLTDFLQWMIDAAGWLDTVGFNASDLAEDIGQIEDAIRTILSPLATANDLLQEFLRLTGLAKQEQGFAGQISGGPGGSRTPTRTGARSDTRSTTNVYVQGGSPEVIEQSVRRAVEGIARRSGALE